MNTGEIIRAIVGGKNFYALTCSVLQVNQSERTCDCRPLNGDADIFGVRLQTDINATVGLQMKPKVGSNVIIGFINKSAAYLIMSSEVEEFEIVIGNTSFKMNGTTIEMNGGSFDGLIKIAALTTKLNSLVTEVTAMKNDYLIHTHSVPALGISLVPTVPFVGNFSQFSKSDFEDTTVKH